jgi:hypothetical protein
MARRVKIMPYPQFDRRQLEIKPLSERVHDMTLDHLLKLDDPVPPVDDPVLPEIAERIVRARQAGRPVILLMGGHVIKQGLSRQVIDLMERGLLTHIAMNGSGPIHDYELALIGKTTESVARYISEGQFGLWRETGGLNEVIVDGDRDGLGLGEAIGRAIETASLPHRDVSICAAGYRLRVPVSVHVGIGYDIIHEHPNCDGAALGAASYRDFLVITQAITQMQGGVVLSVGTQVMGPEIFLKGLAMARNVARQRGESIDLFTTAVFDLTDLGSDIHHEAPKDQAAYYFRPYKTLLVRTVAEGGESFYVRGMYRQTFATLYQQILARMG